MSQPLMDLMEKNEIDFKTSHKDVRSGWLGLKCPWCGGEGQYYLGIHMESLACNCWRCGPHRLSEVLAELLNIGTPQAIAISRTMPSPAFKRPERDNTGRYRPPSILGQAMGLHRDYVRSRGFKPKHLERLWGVGWIGPRIPWAWRKLIPAMEHGKPMSWTTRSVSEECDPSRRYMASPPDRERKPLKDLLYGIDYCRHAIVVTEGPTGPWKIGPGCVATNGLSVTPAQIDVMTAFPVRVIVFDNEKEAQQRAKKLCGLLEVYPGETYRVRIDSPDPGTMTRREINKLRHSFLE
jgi:hypothetical protein